MKTIAVVGLGYVGLPLAVEFGKKYRTLGVDLSPEKIASYKQHCDPTGEVSSEDLKAATLLDEHISSARNRVMHEPLEQVRNEWSVNASLHTDTLSTDNTRRHV